jgi:WD40 repeat protein
VWEATTGDEVSRLTYEGGVPSVAFSSDGKYVVSSGCDNNDCTRRSARVSEAATGHEIARMTYQGEISSVAFSPDGRYVVSVGCDNNDCTQGSARVWAWRPGDLMANACLHVTRNLTHAEWKQYIGDALPYPTKQDDATCPNLPLEPELTPTATP